VQDREGIFISAREDGWFFRKYFDRIQRHKVVKVALCLIKH